MMIINLHLMRARVTRSPAKRQPKMLSTMKGVKLVTARCFTV